MGRRGGSETRPYLALVRPLAARIGGVLAGYALVMGGWFVRNQQVFGAWLAPGGSRALWQRTYDELFIYPPDLLTPERWWADGLGGILQARWVALGQNLQTALAVQGFIFLLPLIIWGLWSLRRVRGVQLVMLGWLLTLGVMTVLFPFAGARGGFFHSGAAFQPLFWTAAAVGLHEAIRWGRTHRGWRERRAWRFFSGALVAFALALSAFIAYGRALGGDLQDPAWNRGAAAYAALAPWLAAQEIPAEAVILVNNPPGFFLAAARPAIAIPDGGLEAVLAAADRYQARYLILESNHPAGLAALYQQPASQPGLRYLAVFTPEAGPAIYLFEVLP